MTETIQTFQQLVDTYLNAVYEGDLSTLHAIFDPAADLRWQEGGILRVISVSDWLEGVKDRGPSKAGGHQRRDFIMTMDHADESLSLAKFLTRTPTGMFTVYLTGCKLADVRKSIDTICFRLHVTGKLPW
jgi:hypothetical protein